LIRLLHAHAIDLVIDIGAASGGYGKKLRQIGYRGEIISFEPLKNAHERLVAASGRDGRWRVAPRMALGERDGEEEMNVAANSDSSSLFPMLTKHVATAPKSEYIRKETVPVRTLDSLFGEIIPKSAKSIFIKMDVQGYEGHVIMGGRNLVRRARGLQIEMSLVPLYEGQPLYLDLIRITGEHGFELHALMPAFTDRRTGQMLQVDGVFFALDRVADEIDPRTHSAQWISDGRDLPGLSLPGSRIT
jgi:FkbM family methyltransferase